MNFIVISPPYSTLLLPIPFKFRTKIPSKPINLIFSPYRSFQNPSKLFSPPSASKTKTPVPNFTQEEEEVIDLDWGDEQEHDAESPWEGAVIYKRNASVTHVEYCTSLERLGLGKVSSEVSQATASDMGIRFTKGIKDVQNGTPVLISVDVLREKGKIRLDGIIRTVFALGCNRCSKPCGKSIFLNFALLLTQEPIVETGVIDMGTIFGEDKHKTSEEEEEDDEASIYFDDRLYFPADQKEVDISKNIRDSLHVEITYDTVCDFECKGLCLKCGADLNVTSCKCSKQNIEQKDTGPFGNLRSKMQRKLR